MVGVHGVRGEADGVCGHLAALAVVLRHHLHTDHAAGFAHVELLLPACAFDELVLHVPHWDTTARIGSGTRGWLASVHISPCW